MWVGFNRPSHSAGCPVEARGAGSDIVDTPHAYWETEPSRYLIFLTPRLDRLISRLHSLNDQSQLRATLAEFDTVLVDQNDSGLPQGPADASAPG
jgi:hypothetical protein